MSFEELVANNVILEAFVFGVSVSLMVLWECVIGLVLGFLGMRLIKRLFPKKVTSDTCNAGK